MDEVDMDLVQDAARVRQDSPTEANGGVDTTVVIMLQMSDKLIQKTDGHKIGKNELSA